jgi:hypothetical protein
MDYASPIKRPPPLEAQPAKPCVGFLRGYRSWLWAPVWLLFWQCWHFLLLERWWWWWWWWWWWRWWW